MNRFRFVLPALLAVFLAQSCSSPPTTESRLREWQRGVWLSDGGAYTIWTDTYYFVVSAAGEGARANIYCGSSQVRYTDKGVARRQNVRLRQMPGTALEIFSDFSMYGEYDDNGVDEAPLQVDMSKFESGTCNIVEGVIYDSVTEETDDYIVLSTCSGYQIKLFSNGRSIFISPDGDESWSFRLETW